MINPLLADLVSVLILGVTAQWLAWRMHLPAILLLLLFGFVAGPVTGFLNPDHFLGDLLFPVVSISVALVLFEGGLSLNLSELRVVGGVVRNLITVGIVVTAGLTVLAASLLLNLSFSLALLLGVTLVVTGPTVIGPLLRQVRPTQRISSALKWEGMLNDPIGAILAVLVFEGILVGGWQKATALAVMGLTQTVLAGAAVGTLGAWIMVLMLQRYLIPEFLQSAFTLMAVVAVFAGSNMLQAESGLLAVTVMGIVLANQGSVVVKHIIEFKENLRVLIISMLFIILAARLHAGFLQLLTWRNLLFVFFLILVVRPAAVFLSAKGSDFDIKEKIFLAFMAPRGIVAAAMATLFTLRLAERGYARAEEISNVTFVVIVITVLFYGIFGGPLARWLQIQRSGAKGMLLVGAHDWARYLAKFLHDEGYLVGLVDTNREHVELAQQEGLQSYCIDIRSPYVKDEIDFEDFGRLVALTSNDEVNSLAALHFVDDFGRAEVYQLPPETGYTGRQRSHLRHLRGRILFGPRSNYSDLEKRFLSGAVLTKATLTKEFGYEYFQALYGDRAVTLCVIDETGALTFFTEDNPPTPRPERHTLISLISPLE
ncbi:MAG: cation:proton antiporter [Candidatus Omnitrophica bacterium]|nr:cation:proton antiporter [Candidatus Omnitrophota bacterium]